MSGPDVRRWRFIVIGPAGAAGATRLGGRDMGTIVLVSSELDCERGRVVDDASLGSADAPFREVLLGAPEARFLCETVSICQKKGGRGNLSPLLDHIRFQRQWTHDAMQFLSQKSRL